MRLQYTRDQLISLNNGAAVNTESRHAIPEFCRRQAHRAAEGKKLRRRRIAAKQQRQKYKPSLPSIVMGNVRSLANKMDELTALAQSQREYRECSLMCFTETWLHEDVPDDNVTIAGFSTVRADRDRASTGKSRGGGLALLVNHRWCSPNHITVKERICSPDVELCTVGLRPYYLPREFSHVVFVGVYTPPSANPRSACDAIHAVVARIQTVHPTALIVISGDFNHVSLDKTLSHFHQFVNCPTREERTLDLCYANVRNAYLATPPPIGWV
ncbi:hypothetical protein NQD34_018253 [Periophthalmus magnuspinnatus]|nr:hypothetical protein NQD34_018253 [Periophthalmus magnuspinnatus]